MGATADRVEEADDAPRGAGGPRAMLVPVWFVWSFGPGTFAGCAFLCALWPKPCDGPNLLLAPLLIPLHVAAAVISLVLVCDRAARRLPELWLLCAYWVFVAGFMAPALLVLADLPKLTDVPDRLLRHLALWSTRAALAAAVAMPLAGITRLLRARCQRDRARRRAARMRCQSPGAPAP